MDVLLTNKKGFLKETLRIFSIGFIFSFLFLGCNADLTPLKKMEPDRVKTDQNLPLSNVSQMEVGLQPKPTRNFSPRKTKPPFAEALSIHELAIHPKNGRILYASTDNQGVLKSTDGGKNWFIKSQGIKAYLLYHLIIDPKKTNTVYTGSYGGGIYKTEDGGDTWSEINDLLGNTAIRRIIISPRDHEVLYLLTSMQVYKSDREKEGWIPILEWGSLGHQEWPEALLLLPSRNAKLLLGTNKGIYKWEEDSGWTKISLSQQLYVTSLAHESRTGIFYAGTLNEGLYFSSDSGENWKLLQGTEKIWINKIVFHPSHKQTFFLLTRTQGILKTSNGGKSWTPIKMDIKNQWINALIFHPKDSEIMFAGTYSDGVLKSVDGGKNWKVQLAFAIQSREERIKALLPKSSRSESKKVPPAPPEFRKCNECHGWTDPVLDSRTPSHYRMAANPRDWTLTVKRMSHRANLLPGEEQEIIRYLNRYFGLKSS